MSYLLTIEQSEKLLKNLSSKWSISDRYLKCIYKFKNIYDTIEVELYTHDENGLTMKDFELSNYMDKIYEKLSLEHN